MGSLQPRIRYHGLQQMGKSRHQKTRQEEESKSGSKGRTARQTYISLLDASTTKNTGVEAHQ